MTKVVLPELGEGIEKAVVSYWYFKPGDKVNEKAHSACAFGAYLCRVYLNSLLFFVLAFVDQG